VIGNDDNQKNALWADIQLLYEVLVDGRRVAVGDVRGNQHDLPLHAEVVGGSSITLRITNVGDAGGATSADWADAALR
jgi:NPCBM/NEW2 domain-containing protein